MRQPRYIVHAIAAVAAATLILLAGTNRSMARDAAGAKPWVLQKGRGIAALRQRKPILHMQGPRLSGSTGCNSFTAALKEGADNNISIEDVTLTRKLCGVLEAGVENAFLSALADTQYLKREGARLTFLSGKQEALLVWTRGGKSARRGPARRSGAYRARWAPRAVAVSRWCGRR